MTITTVTLFSSLKYGRESAGSYYKVAEEKYSADMDGQPPCILNLLFSQIHVEVFGPRKQNHWTSLNS